MNDKIPQALKDKQEKTRQQTINVVIKAINELNEQGFKIRIKDLMEYTGLSRSTFGKPHVRAVLEKYGVAKAQATIKDETKQQRKLTIEDRLKRTIDSKNTYIKRLMAENKAMKEECELLRGKLFLFMQRNE